MSSQINKYDIAIVGAGPAGAMTAILAARAGLKTLLIDKSEFPREKVCGCCINAAVVSLLTKHELQNVVQDNHAQSLSSFTLFSEKHHVSFPLNGGVAISRSAFDLGLINHAIRAGCEFRSATKASILEWNKTTKTRSIHIVNPRFSQEIEAKVVIAACGLAQSALPAKARAAIHVKKRSRIGIGVHLTEDEYCINSGEIHMHLIKGGYAGFTKLENGQIDLAAAIDPNVMHRVGIDTVFHSLNIKNLSKRIEGTQPLSRFVERVAWPGLFMVGDSGGYTEPFTGEGIGLALKQAVTCAPLIARACNGEVSLPYVEWNKQHHKLLCGTRLRCTAIGWATNFHTLTYQTAAFIARTPLLRQPLLNTLQHAGSA